MTPDALEERVVAHLAKIEGVVAAYLFGSRARGTSKAGSDVDVAILLREAPATFDQAPLELAGDLERVLGLPVDVVVLNGAPSDLIHRVLRDGALLVDRDKSARIAFEVRARNDYFDLMHVRRAYRHPRRGGRV